MVLFLQHLESVIKSRIPGIQSLINKSIAEIEAELSRFGKPIAADAGVSFFKILKTLVVIVALYSYKKKLARLKTRIGW